MNCIHQAPRKRPIDRFGQGAELFHSTRGADLTFDVLAADLEAIRRCLASVSHVIAVGTPLSGDMARLSATSRAFFEEPEKFAVTLMEWMSGSSRQRENRT